MDTTLTIQALSSAVVAALVATGVNGFFNWRGLTRTIEHQASQTRQTLDHQATQTRLTLTAQVDQARLADARALRDAKRERLRESYSMVIDVARQVCTMVEAAVVALSGGEGGVGEQQWEALRQEVVPALATAQRYQTLLALEADATDFRAVFEAVTKDAQQANAIYNQRQSIAGSSPSELLEEVRQRYKRMVAGIGELETLARDHLAKFDSPTPALEAAPERMPEQ